MARNVACLRSRLDISSRRNQRDRPNPPAAPNATPASAPKTPKGKPNTAAPVTMNGLAGRKKSEPIARKRESKKTPRGPRAPIQVQRLCNAGTTGKKNEVTARPIARTAAIVSFLANEVTNVGFECGRFGRSDRKTLDVILFYDVRIHQSGEFEHVHFFLAVKDGLQSLIGLDELFILKVIL